MERQRDSIASARATRRGKRVKQKADEAESQELGPSFADLPSEIATHILLLLPIKSVVICKCVCTTWNALISDPHFAKLHFERSTLGVMIWISDPKLVSRTLHLIEYGPEKFDRDCNIYVKVEPKFRFPHRVTRLVLGKTVEFDRFIAWKSEDHKLGVVNSCNGLLCLCDPWNRDPLVVCNPVTGEFIRLPEAPRTDKNRETIYAGFGFQPKTNEYKVIRMWNRYVKSPRDAHVLEFEGLVVEMHTLGTPTWRTVGVDPRFEFWTFKFPTCVNGALHWINFNGLVGPSILCFNFESESFQSFPCPPRGHNGIQHKQHISMGELGGSLYICEAYSSGSVTMWVMKEYGIGESWTKVYNNDNLDGPRWSHGLCWPVKHFKKGAVILMQYSCECFVCYDLEEDEFNIFRVSGTRSKLFEVIPHIPSLISLKDAVKGDNIKVLNVHSWCAKFKLLEEDEVIFLARNWLTQQFYTLLHLIVKNMVKTEAYVLA